MVPHTHTTLSSSVVFCSTAGLWHPFTVSQSFSVLSCLFECNTAKFAQSYSIWIPFLPLVDSPLILPSILSCKSPLSQNMANPSMFPLSNTVHYLHTYTCTHTHTNMHTHTHTHTNTVLTAIFQGEPGLLGCPSPLDFPSPFIPRPCILSRRFFLSFLTQFHPFSLRWPLSLLHKMAQ